MTETLRPKILRGEMSRDISQLIDLICTDRNPRLDLDLAVASKVGD